jgi:hypothetical protein
MSTNRIKPDAGWANQSKLEKGPNGRNLCRWCRTEVPRLARTFCSSPCVHEWRVRSDPGYARKKVEERDHGVCQICGVRTERIEKLLGIVRGRMHAEPWTRWVGQPVRNTNALARARRVVGILNSHGWKIMLKVWPTGSVVIQWSHLWEMDHQVPVVEGGGEAPLDGLRTACRPCHNRETQALRVRLQERRRALSGSTQETLLTVLVRQANSAVPSGSAPVPQAPGPPALGGQVEPGSTGPKAR